jgi:hypothetical protein
MTVRFVTGRIQGSPDFHVLEARFMASFEHGAAPDQIEVHGDQRVSA